jgi:hypothetical protein
MHATSSNETSSQPLPKSAMLLVIATFLLGAAYGVASLVA